MSDNNQDLDRKECGRLVRRVAEIAPSAFDSVSEYTAYAAVRLGPVVVVVARDARADDLEGFVTDGWGGYLQDASERPPEPEEAAR